MFEIEDLVDVLKKDNAVNLFVCTVPREMKYVDYICIVTGKSHRHMLGNIFHDNVIHLLINLLI